MQFVGVIQDMQEEIAPLIKEAKSGANPEEIRPKVIKIRKDHEGKIENVAFSFWRSFNKGSTNGSGSG